nr:alkene reductase [Burkholderia multivorans]
MFLPAKVGNFSLKNRIAMAPMTRSRAEKDGTPTAIMAEYYAQRAGAGLIVSEGVSISAQAQGFLNVPGIFTDAHVEGWRAVTERVHAAASTFFMQLWHVGRIGHSDNMAEGLSPVGPSAIAHDRNVVTPSGMQPAPVPRALTDEEVWATVNDYALAAKRAVAAGCDGVEIHAANGYLPGQFLHETTNLRDDSWGGSLANRARFIIEVAKACADAIGAERVGIRLSPFSAFNGATSKDDGEVYGYLIPELSMLGLFYLHVVTAEVSGNQTVAHEDGTDIPDVVGFARPLWEGTLIAAGGYDVDSANREIEAGRADIIAFGRDFIANPDLPTRLQNGYPLVERKPSDWYGSDEKGYTDYPSWSESKAGTTA